MPEVPDHEGETTEIATGTLAEIYAQQGLVERALEIYRRIARRAPDDERVASRIRELRRALEAADAEDGPSLSSDGEPAGVDRQERAEAADEPAVASDPPEAPIEPPEEPATPLVNPREDAEFLAWLETL